jgi:hypothetical protein
MMAYLCLPWALRINSTLFEYSNYSNVYLLKCPMFYCKKRPPNSIIMVSICKSDNYQEKFEVTTGIIRGRKQGTDNTMVNRKGAKSKQWSTKLYTENVGLISTNPLKTGHKLTYSGRVSNVIYGVYTQFCAFLYKTWTCLQHKLDTSTNIYMYIFSCN